MSTDEPPKYVPIYCAVVAERAMADAHTGERWGIVHRAGRVYAVRQENGTHVRTWKCGGCGAIVPVAW